MTINFLLGYKNNYSAANLWEKLRQYARQIGEETVYYVVLLYYVMVDRNTTWQNRAIIAGALGYLILPLDLIPDSIPVIGYTDDASAILAAYRAVKDSITPSLEVKAHHKVSQWFK